MRALGPVVGLALLLAGAVALSSGCQQARKLSGVRTTVSDPSPDSPEWVIHQAIQAGLEEDETKGWERFRGLLHTRQLASPASEQNWRSMNFATLRRKVKLYLKDDTVPAFRLCYIDIPREGAQKVFVENEMNPDNCTPCQVEQDSAANNAWRIMHCSL